MKAMCPARWIAYKGFRSLELAALRNGPGRQLYWRYVPRLYERVYRLRHPTFSAPLDPFTLRYVDPEQVHSKTGRAEAAEYRNRRRALGEVKQGSWDRRVDAAGRSLHEQAVDAGKFEETVFFQGLSERFEQGREWEDTALYTFLSGRLDETDQTWRGHRTVGSLPEYFTDVDMLYQSIERNGYRTQAELSFRDSADGFGYIDRLINEITIDIGRDGKPLFVDGKHRLAIANLLGIERVPVVVLVRHNEWMKFREKVYRGEVSEDHPDFVDINKWRGSGESKPK